MPSVLSKLKSAFGPKKKPTPGFEPPLDMLGEGLQDPLGDSLGGRGGLTDGVRQLQQPKVNQNSLTIGGIDLGLGGDGSLQIGGSVSPPKPKKQRGSKKSRKGKDRHRGRMTDMLLDGVDPFFLGDLSGEEQGAPPPEQKVRMEDEDVDEWIVDPDDKNESVHEVRRVNYNKEIGDTGTNEGFFKPYSKEFHGSAFGQATGIGKYDKNDKSLKESKLIARSVASTRLDQLLGQNTVSHEFEARHDGLEGVVSGKVKGKALSKLKDLDLKHPEIQKGLSNLQFFDYLSNQQDRHDGNIYVDEGSGKVTGIDNDISWGNQNNYLKSGTGQNNAGLPTHVDRGMYESFSKLSKKDFLKTVSGKKGDHQRLGKKEKKAAKERYKTMQRYLGGEEVDGKKVQIVDEWNDDTYQQHEEAFPRNKSEPGLNYKFFSSMMKVPTLLGRQIALQQTKE